MLKDVEGSAIRELRKAHREYLGNLLGCGRGRAVGPNWAMTGIFISYRRDNAGAWAVAVREQLVRVFGDDHVFLDVDTLGPGDWRAQLNHRLDACRVALVLIGRGWPAARDDGGRLRLFQDDDVHRAEIARALTTSG